MTIDPISQDYIALAFAIERHVEGYVDGYVGPPELQAAAHAAAPVAPGELVARAVDLAARVAASEFGSRRKQYLSAQLRAMQTTGRILAGEPISFADEVERCFDIPASTPPEQLFDAALGELEQALPGSGPLAERMVAYRRQFEVPHDVARSMIDRIAAEARARTAALVELPPGEQVTFALVRDKPWSGYNWYLGSYRSRVEINTDLPIRANALLDLVCHEAYPGHHTEHAIKEQRLYAGRGYGEAAILLINTPECVISEGIATLAAETIFADPVAWRHEHLYPLAGIRVDAEQERQVEAAQRHLRAASARAAVMLHSEGRSADEVLAFLMRTTLRTEREARQTMRFLTTPLWRTYSFTYFAGRDLLGRWLHRAPADRTARFVTLLSEQVSPRLVEGWVIEEELQCPG